MTDETDVTDGRTSGETEASRRGRRMAIEGDMMPSAADIGESVARALERSREESARARPQQLGEIVRVSVRVGQTPEGRPKSWTFTAADTADGRECTIPDGLPVKLKRAAYDRLRQPQPGYDRGVVVLAE